MVQTLQLLLILTLLNIISLNIFSVQPERNSLRPGKNMKLILNMHMHTKW